jgi:C4-dicarboxylate-specific signal transduction histidine kinase
VVEDDPEGARVLRTLLLQAGYLVQVAHDGPTALRLMDADGPPELLILDWMLPGMTGLEVCHQARQRWDALELPILMVTARTDPESMYAAFDAGASDYVGKPFRGAELRARIGAHLRVRRLAEHHQRMEEHLQERDKLSTLGLLAGGVVHDLGNPLAVIAAHAQLLMRRVPDEAAGAQLREILDAVERCRRITGDLLSFVRRRPRQRTVVDVGEVLAATFAMRERPLAVAGIRASLEIADDLPHVFGDAHQLQQVFLNLLVNAEHALRDSGRTMRVWAAAPLDAEAVVVGFYNDGPPIPAGALPRIWEPFFTTKSAEEGTGLGLAICRRIVHEHGGEISASSGDDGTAFVIYLPTAAHD